MTTICPKALRLYLFYCYIMMSIKQGDELKDMLVPLRFEAQTFFT